MLTDVIAYVNSIINIPRADSGRIVSDIIHLTVGEGKDPSPSILGFFKDVVVDIDWTKPHVYANIEMILKRLDQANPSGMHYYRLLDIFDTAIRHHVGNNYSAYIELVVEAIGTPKDRNLKIADYLASQTSVRALLIYHTWLSTIYILSHTDLGYIFKIDLPLALALAGPRS